MQVEFPLLNPEPAGQAVHNPVVETQVVQSLFEQGRHALDPPVENYVPLVHTAHVEFPLSNPEPAGHDVQSPEVTTHASQSLLEQGTQALVPPVENYVPLLHAEQVLVPLLNPEPEGHDVHSPEVATQSVHPLSEQGWHEAPVENVLPLQAVQLDPEGS